MCEVTFTPKQVREIRRRIEAVPFAGRHHAEPDIYRADVLAAFPLPKVTRYRTFKWGKFERRVRDGVVEWKDHTGAWQSHDSVRDLAMFAEHVARHEDWTALAALADVAARPTEEVPDDGR